MTKLLFPVELLATTYALAVVFLTAAMYLKTNSPWVFLLLMAIPTREAFTSERTARYATK